MVSILIAILDHDGTAFNVSDNPGGNHLISFKRDNWEFYRRDALPESCLQSQPVLAILITLMKLHHVAASGPLPCGARVPRPQAGLQPVGMRAAQKPLGACDSALCIGSPKPQVCGHVLRLEFRFYTRTSGEAGHDPRRSCPSSTPGRETSSPESQKVFLLMRLRVGTCLARVVKGECWLKNNKNSQVGLS